MTRNTNIDWRALANPWGLTKRQCEMLDAYVAGYCEKRAADTLNVSQAAVSELIGVARRKMGAQTRIQVLIQWDRYRRGDRSQMWGIAV